MWLLSLNNLQLLVILRCKDTVCSQKIWSLGIDAYILTLFHKDSIKGTLYQQINIYHFGQLVSRTCKSSTTVIFLNCEILKVVSSTHQIDPIMWRNICRPSDTLGMWIYVWNGNHQTKYRVERLKPAGFIRTEKPS